MKSVNLTTKVREIIERGPPEGLVASFHKLFGDKIEATMIKAGNELRANLEQHAQIATDITAQTLVVLLSHVNIATSSVKAHAISRCGSSP